MFEITADNMPVRSVTNTNYTTVSSVERFKGTTSIMILGFSLCFLQAMDGLLTAIGISRYGHAIEGNPLLRSLMEEYGHGLTLMTTKLFAISIVIMLTLIAHKISWVKNALGALNCIYLFGAVLPWAYILFINPNS